MIVDILAPYKHTLDLLHRLTQHEAYFVMIQQTDTNSVGSNNNSNPNIISGGGRSQGGFGGCRDCRNNTSIAKWLSKKELKDECLHTLTITEDSYQDTQLKKI